jgi:hypothetical protein
VPYLWQYSCLSPVKSSISHQRVCQEPPIKQYLCHIQKNNAQISPSKYCAQSLDRTSLSCTCPGRFLNCHHCTHFRVDEVISGDRGSTCPLFVLSSLSCPVMYARPHCPIHFWTCSKRTSATKLLMHQAKSLSLAPHCGAKSSFVGHYSYNISNK